MSDMITIGCDISKAKIDLCVLQGQKVLLRLTAPNTELGVAGAVEELMSWRGSIFVLEPTSYYHYRTAFLFRNAGFDVRQANPFLVSQFMKLGLRKTKTDKADAKGLAILGSSGQPLRPFTETPETIGKKARASMLSDLREHLQKFEQRVNQLRELNGIIGSMTDVVSACERAQGALRREKKKQERWLTKDMTQDTKIVASIPGVSSVTVAVVTSYLGDVNKFEGRDAVSAYAGLDPSIGESGSSVKKKSHITKRGSAELRGALTRAAWGVMMHNPKFQEYAARKKAAGKHYFTILVAMARKLLVMIYGMLKRQEFYNPNLFTPQVLTAV